MDTGQTPRSAQDIEAVDDLSTLPKRQAIVMAAKAVFLERGFTHATMDDIALRAGTTKRTVYNHFTNKEELFVAIVELVSQRFLEKLPPPDHYGDDMAAALECYAARFCELTTWTDAVALQRMILGEFARFPELAAQLCRIAVTAKDRLAAYLQERATAGALSVDDAGLAAAHLLDMATASRRLGVLFGVEEPLPGPPEETISPAIDRRAIRSAVAVFLDHYRRPGR